MMTIEVWETTRARQAVPRASASSTELLVLLGLDISGATDKRRSPLGDALAAIADGLALVGDREVLASADVVESEGGRQRVGDVLPAGGVDALSGAALGTPERPTLVADAADPKESMAEQLRTRLQREPRAVVMGVLSLGEAADRLFGLRAQALAGTLVPEACRARACEVLFQRSLDRSRLAWDWDLVSAIATGLALHIGGSDERALFELRLVRDIANRHTGISAPIAWPDDDDLMQYEPERRLTILAHVVQSAADGDWAAIPEYAERARRAVGATRSAEALKLLGAAGRALAAVGDYEAAAQTLQIALDAWLATTPAGGSYALSELLRIEGIRGRTDRVSALREIAEGILLPLLDIESRPYITLAVGRALAQAGRADESLRVLEGDGIGAHAARHVQTAAQRWRAVAARALGQVDHAADALERLERLGDSDQRLLAQLDGEQLDVLETKAHLDDLLALPSNGGEAHRLMNRLAPGLSTRAIAETPEVLRRLRSEYRY